MDSGTRNVSARTGRRGVRTTVRLAGTAISVAALVGLTPAVADAAPHRPSNSQIDHARASANAVAARIGALSDKIDAAEGAVAAKQADAAIALDEYQSTHEAFVAAKKKSDAAAAASAKATADVGVARTEVVAFARRSYMDGSTYSGAAALITAGNPSELIQRAALLEAAGTHRSDVLDTVKVLQGRAKAAETVARETLASADALQTRAADAMATAQAAETSARQDAAALVTQKTQLQSQLTAAKAELVHLIGARAAADRAAQMVRPAAGPPPVSVSPAPSVNQNHAGDGNASAAQIAIDAAMAYRGTRYAWGGGGSDGPGPGLPPDRGVIGFDCSGLTQYAYARAGISIPRNSRAQYADLPKVSSDDLRPGDLVFWATNPSDPDTIHHVAIYLGNGRVVQAPESGDVVKDSPMWWRGYAGAVRPTA